MEGEISKDSFRSAGSPSALEKPEQVRAAVERPQRHRAGETSVSSAHTPPTLASILKLLELPLLPFGRTRTLDRTRSSGNLIVMMLGPLLNRL